MEQSFRWDKHSDHWSNILKELMVTNDFADVTLVCDDKKQIKSHRNILSACSPVFKNILNLTSSINHPVIYLRGIKHSEMKSILDFIYLGEANCHEKKVDEFLSVARNLEIKQLSECIEEGAKLCKDLEVPDEVAVFKTLVRNSVTTPGTDLEVENHEIEKSQTEKEYFETVFQAHTDNTDDDLEEIDEDEIHDDQNEASNQVIIQRKSQAFKDFEGKYKSIEGKLLCLLCENIYDSFVGLVRHMQIKHEKGRFKCDKCEYKAGYKGDLNKHIRSKHDKIKFPCTRGHCDYQSSSSSNLNAHIKSIHDGVKYSCEHCEYTSGFRSGINQHVKRCVKRVKSLSLQKHLNK